jgi:DNA-binding response OmpR family regulator
MCTTNSVVLYVEDDALIRELSINALEEAGFVVVSADSGKAALEVLGSGIDGPGALSIRAVVTDVNLGSGPDGWAVAKRAREMNHDLPIIYVTGAAGGEWTTNGVTDSVMVIKPFPPGRIAALLSWLLNLSGTKPTPEGCSFWKSP